MIRNHMFVIATLWRCYFCIILVVVVQNKVELTCSPPDFLGGYVFLAGRQRFLPPSDTDTESFTFTDNQLPHRTIMNEEKKSLIDLLESFNRVPTPLREQCISAATIVSHAKSQDSSGYSPSSARWCSSRSVLLMLARVNRVHGKIGWSPNCTMAM